MRNDLTEIAVVVDRSGSMAHCREDAEGGLNTFIESQKKEPGRAKFTLVQFDDLYDVVHDGVNIQDVPPYKLVPRGWTALLDAIGKTINTVGERLSNTSEHERPGLVIVVIITDGHENRSKEYSGPEGLAKIRQMIEHQQKVYNWQFTFLGADASVFEVAGGMGIAPDAAAAFNAANPGAVYKNMAKKTSALRASNLAGEKCSLSYNDEDREEIAGNK